MELYVGNEPEQKKNRKWWYVVFALCLALIAFTGLKGTLVGTLFFLLMVVLLVVGRKDETLILYLVLNVFFGYSEIKVNLVVGGSLAPSTIMNLFSLLICCKLLLFRIRIVINAKQQISIMLVTYVVLISILTSTLVAGVVLMCQLIIVLSIMEFFKEGNEESLKKYTICFTFAIIAEVIYGLMFNTNTAEYGWRALQFAGVADPNNLSLACNILLAIIVTYGKRIGLGKAFAVVKIGLCVVVVCTLSFSGLVTMLCILVFDRIMKRNLSAGKRLISIIIVSALALLVVLSWDAIMVWMKNCNVPTLRGLAERLSAMGSAADEQNYDGVTSGRTVLWERWMREYVDLSISVQLFGSNRAFAQVQNTLGHAPHNVYIDIFVKYGIIGGILFLCKILHSIWRRIVEKDYLSLFITVVMLFKLFARSMNISSAILYGFLI